MIFLSDFIKPVTSGQSRNILKNIKNSNQSLHDFETYLLKLKEECLHVNY